MKISNKFENKLKIIISIKALPTAYLFLPSVANTKNKRKKKEKRKKERKKRKKHNLCFYLMRVESQGRLTISCFTRNNFMLSVQTGTF